MQKFYKKVHMDKYCIPECLIIQEVVWKKVYKAHILKQFTESLIWILQCHSTTQKSLYVVLMETDSYHNFRWGFLSPIHRNQCPILSSVISLLSPHCHRYWPPRCCFTARNRGSNIWEAKTDNIGTAVTWWLKQQVIDYYGLS
jgi:hypothetical protein